MIKKVNDLIFGNSIMAYALRDPASTIVVHTHFDAEGYANPRGTVMWVLWPYMGGAKMLKFADHTYATWDKDVILPGRTTQTISLLWESPEEMVAKWVEMGKDYQQPWMFVVKCGS